MTLELIRAHTIEAWICDSVCDHIVETEFYYIGEGQDLITYWRDYAKSYDGYNWDEDRSELLFWMHIVYKLCEKYHSTGLFRDVKNVMIIRGFNHN